MKAIHATAGPICSILRDHEFVIPAYQRPYSWDKEECEQLWDDLKNFFDNSKSTDKYFLGSIVVHSAGNNNKKLWKIIDGQQRLVTILIFIRALFSMASTETILEKIIFKENPWLGEPIKGQPRLTLEVLQEEGQAEDLKKVLNGNCNEVKKNSLFRLNYEIFENNMKEWWETKKTPARKKIIKSLTNRIDVLPIECESKDDALKLFEIINNRGKPLNDADIFKADMFGAVSKKDRNEFIKRWQKIGIGEKFPGEKHIEMFRIYMHISRAENAEDKIPGREINIRKYMQDHHLRDSDALSKNWQGIMRAMEACNFVRENSTSDEGGEPAARERIYWSILRKSPNYYWQFPLYVFLNKHMTQEGDTFVLPADKHDDYAALMRNTIRYFFIKATVHKTVNSVKDTTYAVYTAIAKEKGYVGEYYKNASDDMEPFLKKLHSNDLGRCLQGLAFLGAALNPEQDPGDCGRVFQENPHLEHILPKKWNHYDKWTEELHKGAVEKIGNLMPLEYRVNIAASNEFFARKKKEYKESKMQDALDLDKFFSTWYPDDIKQRQEKVVGRLEEFFTDPEFSGK